MIGYFLNKRHGFIRLAVLFLLAALFQSALGQERQANGSVTSSTSKDKQILVDSLSSNASTSSESADTSSGLSTVSPGDVESSEAAAGNAGGEKSETKSASRIEPGNTLYIEFTAAETETDDEGVEQEDASLVLEALIPTEKIFVLDDLGILNLPYIDRIPLAGLTEEQASIRIQAERLFSSYTVTVRILPVVPLGEKALHPFGYELFETAGGQFALADNVPVPMNYVIGPGDEIIVHLYGTKNLTYVLQITREGAVDFPEIGPIAVAGLSFGELRQAIHDRVKVEFIGVQANVTLAELRSITVYLVGDVKQPGSYTMSALATVTNALSIGGGVDELGSLRKIQVKRRGKIKARLDLYDLLLRGNNQSDIKLKDGDVIFVPPVNATISVFGAVRRPAIYELLREDNVAQAIRLAGGTLPSAQTKQITLERINRNKVRELLEVNLSQKASASIRIRDGDKIVVPKVVVAQHATVKISGYVKRPGESGWFKGMKLADVVASVDDLGGNPDTQYILIKRTLERPPSRKKMLKVFSTRLTEASRVLLEKGDEVLFFGLDEPQERQAAIMPVIEKLKQQATSLQPAPIVTINGAVFAPGTYPLDSEMKVSDLLKASGKLQEDAFAVQAEITRQVIVNEYERELVHISVDLKKIIDGDGSANVVLQSRDSLMVKRVPQWIQQDTVELGGEVKFPGDYPIARGEQLSSVIERAGGLTDLAHVKAAFFFRKSLKEQQKAILLNLADRVERELKATLLERIDEVVRPQEAFEAARDTVELLRTVEPVGRIIINLPKILEGSENGLVTENDITLEADDTIYIPKFKSAVAVIGEVNQPVVVAYQEALERNEYIARAGGITEKSNQDLVYILHADGSSTGDGSWQSIFSSGYWGNLLLSSVDDIQPGDTVVVPLDVEKIRTLKLWLEVSRVFSNIVTPAAAAAFAVSSFR